MNGRIALFYLIFSILMDGHSCIIVYSLFISMFRYIWNSYRWRFSHQFLVLRFLISMFFLHKTFSTRCYIL